MPRQSDRSQAFSDIFGRPSASRPPTSSAQRPAYPQQPSRIAPGYARPQSYYGYPAPPGQAPAGAGGYSYVDPNGAAHAGPSTGRLAHQGDVAQHTMGGGYQYNLPPGAVTLPPHQHQQHQPYPHPSHHPRPIPPGGGPPYDNGQPYSSPQLGSSRGSYAPSVPYSPSLAAFAHQQPAQQTTGTQPGRSAHYPGVTLTDDPSNASSNISTATASAMSSTSALNSAAPSSSGSGGSTSRAPRLPSLDMTGEFNWIGNAVATDNRGANSGRDAGTAGSTPSAASSGQDDISPGIERLSVADYDYASSGGGTRSYPSSHVTTPAENVRNAYASQYALDGEIGHRDSPASATSGSDSTNHQYFPLPDRESSISRGPQGPREPFEGFSQNHPAGSADQYAQMQHQQQYLRASQPPLDHRTSMDSDHTSFYIPSTSSDARPYYPSGPSSTTTHTTYSQYPSGAPLYTNQSINLSNSMGPGYPGHHAGYAQPSSIPGAPPPHLLRHSSSRKSSESVRVYPTQPKAQVYQDRSFSFSGIERPDSLMMRPNSHSPRPGSSISELPTVYQGQAPMPGQGGSPSFGHGTSPGHSQQGHPSSQSRHGHSNSLALRRAPIVYPALLSRVADSFKARLPLAERTKDGLSYKDAFDGREAVDRIAHIIRTTDRNLALLLGRALDAQKFFHDVTYDHRLRDSPNELYQFRERLHAGPFGSSADADAADAAMVLNNNGMPIPRPPSPTDTMLSDEGAVPVGVFTLLTDCYSPTCTRDRLCYSIACPRRLEQQARLNMKLKPGLKEQTPSEEQSLGDDDRLGYEPGMLWIHMVSKEVSDAVNDTEKKRQESINELIYTERDFVRDMEYLRDKWMAPLRTGPTIPEARREEFVNQVFWNVVEIHDVNIKIAEAMTRRQKQQPVVNQIGDLLLRFIPDFGAPFVKYGAHQLYGKYEFEKEKGSNPAFLKFVETTERLPESRKLELNGYLTKPTTRLARYPLLLEAILKQTPEGNPDKENIPKAVKMIRELLGKLNHESGRSEARFNLAQLDSQLVFRPGEAVDLKLRDESRDLIFKGPLKKRGGTQSESAELQVFLFDHAILMVKAKGNSKTEQFKVYRKPIPLELLVVSTSDDPTTLRNSTARPKSLMSRTSNASKLNLSTNGSNSKNNTPEPTSKMGFPITFNHLGRKGYNLTLWSPSFAGRRKWIDKIVQRQVELRERSMVFESSILSENYFVGTNRVNCAAPYDGGTRMVFGTDNGVYIANLLGSEKVPTKVISCTYVTQVDVLEDYGILVVLADKAVQTFLLDGLAPDDAVGAAKRARKISTNASFFKTGVCLNRTLVCIVKSGTVSSTIKTLEPIDTHGRGGKKQPTIRKLLQGGNELLRVYKEFYIPTESSSVHFLKSKLCVGCTKGFEIVDLDTLDTQGLLDPADSSLDFVQKRENVRPLAIYRVDGDFLLCYDEFAFYVNKNGWRARSNWLVQWEGSPTAFALHYPYVLAFEPTFVEVRHVDSGALMQIIPGISLRLLFADTPPSSSASMAAAQNNPHFPYPYQPNAPRQSAYGQQYSPPVRLPGPRKQIIYTSDSGVLTLRETA